MIASASKSDQGTVPLFVFEKGDSPLSELLQLIGTPYCEGGRTPETGFDCWGFVQYVYAMAGRPLPPDVYEAGRCFARLPVGAAFRAFDLAYLRWPEGLLGRRHVGVLVEPGWMLHCSRATNGVARSELARPYFARHLVGLYRLEAR